MFNSNSSNQNRDSNSTNEAVETVLVRDETSRLLDETAQSYTEDTTEEDIHIREIIRDVERGLDDVHVIPVGNNDTADQAATTFNSISYDDDDISRSVHRIRFIFYSLFIPVVPISIYLTLTFISLVINAMKSDTCSHPLRCFVLTMVTLLTYIPNHQRIKAYFFEQGDRYSPLAAKLFDNIFYFCILMFCFYELTLKQMCGEDLTKFQDKDISTCQVSCPDLYESFLNFDFLVRLFILMLMTPLILMPFVVIYLMRRMRINGVDFHVRDRHEYTAGGALVKDIMKGLREVTLRTINVDGEAKLEVTEKNEGVDNLGEKLVDGDFVKECCICMMEFDLENGSKAESRKRFRNPFANPRDINGNSITATNDCIVMTKCGHVRYFNNFNIFGFVYQSLTNVFHSFSIKRA